MFSIISINIFLKNHDLEFLMFLALAVPMIALIFWIVSLYMVKVRTRVVGESTICFYSGFCNKILLVNARECDRAKGSNDYLYAQLPDGRQVLAKQSNSNGEIKIIIGNDNESNINIM